MPPLDPCGIEWVIEARGCAPQPLSQRSALTCLFREICRDIDLHPVGAPAWHRFPRTGGLTGFWILKESHLACHTFPEYRSACFNLFCCRSRPEWNWNERLAHHLGATQVEIRLLTRSFAPILIQEPV